jgi:hypothetical protein
MAGSRKRPNPRTQETIYRVYRLPEDLRAKLKARRIKFHATTAQVLQNAIDEALPRLVSELKALGFGFDGVKKRPARLPMSDGMLSSLKIASKQVGIDASKLLQAALQLMTTPTTETKTPTTAMAKTTTKRKRKEVSSNEVVK